MVNFTLDELADFSREEKKLIQDIMGAESTNELLSPRKDIVNNILGFSKALSTRNSKFLDTTSMVLN